LSLIESYINAKKVKPYEKKAQGLANSSTRIKQRMWSYYVTEKPLQISQKMMAL
jgi:hypothetical protein